MARVKPRRPLRGPATLLARWLRKITEPEAPGQRKKKLWWRAGTVALRQIRELLKFLELLVPFAPYVRLVRKITYFLSAEVLRWTPEALLTLQEAALYHLMELSEVATLCAIHAKRVTISKREGYAGWKGAGAAGALLQQKRPRWRAGMVALGEMSVITRDLLKEVSRWTKALLARPKVHAKFLIQCLHWWKSCNLHYPKMTSFQTGSETSSSTSDSAVDSTQFYLKKFQIGKCLDSCGSSILSDHVNNPQSFSNKVDAFRKSSYLSNGAPRFEECTCVCDIPTNDDTMALNDDSERYADVSKEVNDMEIGLTVGNTLREGSHGDIAANVTLAPTVECTNDAVNEGLENTPLISTYRKKTPVASLKSQSCQKKDQHKASNEKSVGPLKEQRYAHGKFQGATRSPVIKRNLDPYFHQSPLTRGRIKALSISTPEALELEKTRSGRVVVPALDAGYQWIVYDWDGSVCGVVGLYIHRRGTKGAKHKHVGKKRRAQ